MSAANDNEILVREAADRIRACFSDSLYRGAVEVAVWQKANGYRFMKEVLALLKDEKAEK